MKILGVIPARLHSTRLPGKVLRLIAGKPMVHWVYQNARRSPLLTEISVATDRKEVYDSCAHAEFPVMMTAEHPSGSDRLYEVLTRTDADVYVNIQGDEPTLKPEHIEKLLAPILDDREAEISTLKVKIGVDDAQNPNNVKVVTATDGRALYFSRSLIPYNRDNYPEVEYFKHIGLYAYTRAALTAFHGWPQGALELSEQLEQLRYLENGAPIYVSETPFETVGVDTEAELQEVIALFENELH
ncbi:MAG: kdsB [Capsulimonas sp.]|nr:kdsB [Capsulimonas sp.]